MKQSFSLVLIFVALSSALPTDFNNWNKQSTSSHDTVYSRVGQILQSGHLGDLKHVRTNGLEASYPDELADFLAKDQFSSLNWRLYSKLDTMDLGQWETQSKSEQPQHDDYLQPKWITEWQIPDHLDPTWDDLPEVPDEFPMPEAFNHPRMVAFPSLIF